MDAAGMGVLEQPGTIGLLPGSEHLYRLVHPPVRRIDGRSEVLQGPQHVVVPAGRKREVQPGRFDDVAGALATEKLSFEEVRLAPASRRDGCRRATRCLL